MHIIVGCAGYFFGIFRVLNYIGCSILLISGNEKLPHSMQGIDGAKRLKVKFNTYSLGKYFFLCGAEAAKCMCIRKREQRRQQNDCTVGSVNSADGRMIAL